MPSSEFTSRHALFEDVVGIITGAVLFSVGLAFLQASRVLTGGTVGVALLISQHFGGQVGTIYLIVGIPFLLLAWWKKGWSFALRSVLTLALVSVFSDATPRLVSLHITNQCVAALVANVLLGVGMLVIFRHHSSLGGFSVVGLLAQEKLHIRAGYVQLSLDLVIFLIALATYSYRVVGYSVVGDIVLNITIALNHRTDRYLGQSAPK
jgi:uncharacterized membrane-anchored protein YitT (DUF2179 family)